MVVKETLVICDSCGDNGSGGDDRNLTAAKIRQQRKEYGWTQKGAKDYCDKCSGKDGNSDAE